MATTTIPVMCSRLKFSIIKSSPSMIAFIGMFLKMVKTKMGMAIKLRINVYKSKLN
ncbi:hypothetical protein D9M72_439460 [compost metagenome]